MIIVVVHVGEQSVILVRKEQKDGQGWEVRGTSLKNRLIIDVVTRFSCTRQCQCQHPESHNNDPGTCDS